MSNERRPNRTKVITSGQLIREMKEKSHFGRVDPKWDQLETFMQQKNDPNSIV